MVKSPYKSGNIKPSIVEALEPAKLVGLNEGPQELASDFTGAMDFGLAIRCMEAGKRVQRAGWNGKGMWIALSGLDGPREVDFDQFWSKIGSDYAKSIGGAAVVLPCFIMKTATGEILMGWLASQTDMLAKDWRLVG